LDSGEETTTNFDFLHIAPPQTAPAFIRESPLAANVPAGWLDVKQNTLQHNKYANIFGLGDVCNLPTAKTAAGVFNQVPVVAHNLLVQMGKKPNSASYSGYSSCPLFVGDGKLMMIEFKYGAQPDETFWKSQTTPSRLFYFFKKWMFPFVYWQLMPRGLWYGRQIVPPRY
jgi:sulfide:quinone oxidoreductase